MRNLKMDKDYKRLIKNAIGLSIIAGVIVVVYLLLTKDSGPANKIDSTPIRIESIRNIAELSTVSYSDEVVIDSVIYYKELEALSNVLDAYDLTQRIIKRNVKRRLTLIFRGEVKYGLQLTDKNFETSQNNDTLWLILPKPELLDLILTPSDTEIYQEQGFWSDAERKEMEAKAKKRLKENALKLKLDIRAEKNATKLFKRLIRTDKTIVISYE